MFDDGWRLKTDPAEHPDPAQSDSLVELHRWLDARSRSIRLADLLIDVENDLGFSVDFQRPDERVDPWGSVRAARRDPDTPSMSINDAGKLTIFKSCASMGVRIGNTALDL